MATIGSFEAKTKFSALLERVEQGEQILITRRGKPVARLMPIATARKEKVSAAMERLRKLRKGTTLGGLGWKELRDAGRKY
ncbi:type II toxin-antitoxin system Phd/YefM family antitoxin [Reyranella sp.]|uniref:type II toxin-antitoxin system Phd/YefM family antitoxin n=1 Tax=Reyranella sp. TaxID=1929291 RepID=UPI003784BDAB